MLPPPSLPPPLPRLPPLLSRIKLSVPFGFCMKTENPLTFVETCLNADRIKSKAATRTNKHFYQQCKVNP